MSISLETARAAATPIAGDEGKPYSGRNIAGDSNIKTFEIISVMIKGIKNTLDKIGPSVFSFVFDINNCSSFTFRKVGGEKS